MQWQWLMGPLIGSVIGYITNDIAIRMMFRPHRANYILGRKVPFTPGLIPKERPRLARAIREVLDHDLLSPEIMESALLSGRIVTQIEAAADSVLQSVFQDARTPRMLLENAFGKEDFDTFEIRAKRMAGIFLMEKILDSGIESTLAKIAVSEARERVSHSTAGIAKLFWDDRRSASMEETLTQTIREMLATHGPGMMDDMINNAVRDGIDTPISVLAARHEDKQDDIRAFLVTQYKRIIRAGLSSALRALDLGAIVEERLNDLNMAELEGLIMQVMRKELRAIVWLGALLGAVMGTLNALVPI